MSELLMNDVRKKFAGAREACPGMSDEVYAITDYIATFANDTLVASGILMMLIGLQDDLAKSRCGFGPNYEFPEFLATHKLQAQAQLPYILQIIDAIVDDEAFADEVRNICKEAFHWNVAKRIVDNAPISSHENINVAVDWWAEAIQHPKMDNGTDELSMLMAMFGGKGRQYSAEEIRKFRETLTHSIVGEMARTGRVRLSVDYGPDRLLGEAGDTIGLGQFNYPCKTTMWISETEVSVSAGNGAPTKVIWSASSKVI